MSENPMEAHQAPDRAADGAPDQDADQPLTELSDRLRALTEQPVADHPAVLEAVHRAVVAELEGLGTAAGPRPPHAPRSADG